MTRPTHAFRRHRPNPRPAGLAQLPLAGILLLAWGASPVRAGTTIINTPVTGPITVNAGDTVEIQTGGAITSANTGVIVKSGGELIIQDGSISGGGQSEGVFIDGGTVTMSGGTVSGFIGVTFNTSGTMTMSNGSVTGRLVGVVVNSGGTANISGGSVTGPGESVLLNGGLANISGGTITGTPGANNVGVGVDGGEANISGGSVSGKVTGVGVGPGGVANISGGSVSGTPGVNNSGLNVTGGTATVSGGSVSGGQDGVSVTAGTATISHGTVSGAELGLGVTGGAATVSGGSLSGLLGLEVTGGTATVSGCNLLRAGGTLLGVLRDGTALNLPVSAPAPGQLLLDSATMQITCPPNQTALATSAAGAVVTFPAPVVANTCGGTVQLTCAPASGSTFPLGDTQVTCSVTDTFGNSSSCHFTVTVLPASDLAVAISAASGKSRGNTLKVNAGQSLTYTIVVLNGGPSPADAVTVQDNLPDSFVFESANASQGTVLAPPAGATGPLTANLGALAAHGSATVQITGHFQQRKATIPNTASVASSGTDPNPANNQATANVTVN